MQVRTQKKNASREEKSYMHEVLNEVYLQNLFSDGVCKTASCLSFLSNLKLI